MPIKVWITNKVHNFRHRHHEHSMSTATTSTTISSADSLIERYHIRMELLRRIRVRMAAVLDYCTFETPDEERCGSCKERKAKFLGENCIHARGFCRMCCYIMTEKGFKNWEGGDVHTDCPICFKEVTLLRRCQTRSIGDGFDDNSSNSEMTMSIREFTESLIRESGILNRGYESSGSL